MLIVEVLSPSLLARPPLPFLSFPFLSFPFLSFPLSYSLPCSFLSLGFLLFLLLSLSLSSPFLPFCLSFPLNIVSFFAFIIEEADVWRPAASLSLKGFTNLLAAHDQPSLRKGRGRAEAEVRGSSYRPLLTANGRGRERQPRSSCSPGGLVCLLPSSFSPLTCPIPGATSQRYLWHLHLLRAMVVRSLECKEGNLDKRVRLKYREARQLKEEGGGLFFCFFLFFEKSLFMASFKQDTSPSFIDFKDAKSMFPNAFSFSFSISFSFFSSFRSHFQCCIIHANLFFSFFEKKKIFFFFFFKSTPEVSKLLMLSFTL